MKDAKKIAGRQMKTGLKLVSPRLRASAFNAFDSEFRIPNSSAFTLVELLVVIAIIAVLAGLILGGAGIATAKSRISRVSTERDELITAIEHYQKQKGYYPPDNTNSDVTNLLLYELTGATFDGTTFTSVMTGEKLSTNDVNNYFNVGGILNSSSDPTTPALNYFPGMKANQHITISLSPSVTFHVLGVPVPGPIQINAAAGAAGGPPFINPWHYNVSHPTNNADSYDLWMDVIIRGVTNRISNWRSDPQPL